MPSSTAIYPFEYKSLDAIADISIRLNGKLSTYLIIFDDQGHISKVIFERFESTWFEEVDKLRAAKQPHLFFDPFDVPEHKWISWLGLRKSTMEQFMGAAFQTDDFKPAMAHNTLSEGTPLIDFPSAWEVMF